MDDFDVRGILYLLITTAFCCDFSNSLFLQLSWDVSVISHIIWPAKIGMLSFNGMNWIIVACCVHHISFTFYLSRLREGVKGGWTGDGWMVNR